MTIHTCDCGKTYKTKKAYNNHIEKCSFSSQSEETKDYKKLYEKLLAANKLLTEENSTLNSTIKTLRNNLKTLENTCNGLFTKVVSYQEEISRLESTSTKVTNNSNNVNIQVYITLDKKPINPINFKQIIADLTNNTNKVLEDHKYDKVIKFDSGQSDMYFLKEKPKSIL